jgi:hypothetical protein
LLSCSALALLSLSVSIAVERIFRPSGYDAHEEEECHLRLRDTEKEREGKKKIKQERGKDEFCCRRKKVVRELWKGCGRRILLLFS